MYRLADLLGERGHNASVLQYEFAPNAQKPKLRFAREIVHRIPGSEDWLKFSLDDTAEIPWKDRGLMLFKAIRLFNKAINFVGTYAFCNIIILSSRRRRRILQRTYCTFRFLVVVRQRWTTTH